MFLPERYRLQPWRCPMTTAFEPAPDTAIEPDPEPDAPENQTVDKEQLTDEQFLKALHANVDGVRAGLVPAGREDAHPTPKDRPWGRRHKRRDRYGRVIG